MRKTFNINEALPEEIKDASAIPRGGMDKNGPTAVLRQVLKANFAACFVQLSPLIQYNVIGRQEHCL